MIHLTLLLISALSLADPKDPVYPEDGSMPLRSWFTSGTRSAGTGVDYKRLSRLLRDEGVELRAIDYPYAFFQDLAYFSESGALMLQPEPPDATLRNPDGNVTLGRHTEEWGWMRLTREHAEKASLRYRELKWVIGEGGGIVTGKFPNGRTYALTTPDALQFIRKSGDVDTEVARQRFAEDLGISPEGVVEIPASRHIDLLLMALPGGRILLQDNELSRRVARRLSQDKSIPAEERARYLVISRAPEWIDSDSLERIAQALKSRFEVIRVAAIFSEPGSIEFKNGTRTNFLNGFHFTNPSGKRVAFTNKADYLKPLPALEEHWRQTLAPFGFEPGHVHFVGHYLDNFGLDCEGTPGGAK